MLPAIAPDLTGALRRGDYRPRPRVVDAFLAPLAALEGFFAVFAGARLAAALAGALRDVAARLAGGAAAMAASTASRLSSSTASTSSAGADSCLMARL